EKCTRERSGGQDGATETLGLLTILKKMKQNEQELPLFMLGLDSAGKTTIWALPSHHWTLNIWDVTVPVLPLTELLKGQDLMWVLDSANPQHVEDCHRTVLDP
ncbi:ADP-ribosylation factor-like protein 2, partial [Galemys pyrenaicus]